MNVTKGTFQNIWQAMASRPVHFFAITSFIAGILFILLVPPFQIPDEFTHFTRSYEVSELKTSYRHRENDIDRKGSDLPKSIIQTYNRTTLYHKSHTPDVAQARKFSVHQAVASAKIPLDKQSKVFYDTSAVPAYFPLLYLPQAIVIKLLSVLNAPVIVMLYATRLVGLLIWITAGVLALRLLRPSKYGTALASVLLLPMFVAQASASTDPLINGLAVLFLAIVAKMILVRQALTGRTMVILLAMLTIMALSKPVYLTFGFAALLLTARYKGYKSWLFRLACVGVPFLLYIIWTFVSKDSGAPLYVDSIAIGHADPSAQVGYLFPNIFNFAEPFVNTLFLGWGDGVTASLMGVFGKLDTPLPLFFIILGYVAVFVAICARVAEQDDTVSKRLYRDKWTGLLVSFIAAAYIGGVYLAMYIYSTPPHEKIVTGVQGRYLLPLIPMLVIFVPKHWLIMKRVVYNVLLTAGPLLLLAVSALTIYLRYYVMYP